MRAKHQVGIGVNFGMYAQRSQSHARFHRGEEPLTPDDEEVRCERLVEEAFVMSATYTSQASWGLKQLGSPYATHTGKREPTTSRSTGWTYTSKIS
jgi:hypothetical protein